MDPTLKATQEDGKHTETSVYDPTGIPASDFVGTLEKRDI